MAEQVRLAGLIQRRMIPSEAPLISGLDIAATYIPSFEVGGDFYDFLKVGDSRIIVVIADVIGKGVPAALMMSWFRGAIHTYTNDFRRILRTDADAERTISSSDTSAADHTSGAVKHFNKMACAECRDGEFITLFYAIIDAKEKTITYSNCGHEPTVLIRNGKTRDLDKGGLVLGVEPEAEYEIETIKLKDGDCLLFYTDGLIDAANFEGQLWGRENMLEAAKKFTSGSAEQMVKNILGYRRRFVGLAEQIDDTSIVAVKIK
jgi:sigma-B regulation protein RsbU (phosphoserine phosphatase)